MGTIFSVPFFIGVLTVHLHSNMLRDTVHVINADAQTDKQVIVHTPVNRMLARGLRPRANINNSQGQHLLFRFTGVLTNLLPERKRATGVLFKLF